MTWHQDDEYEKELEKKENKPGSKAATTPAVFTFFGFLILLGLVLYLNRSCNIMYQW